MTGTCELAIIGAGPAGMAAATTAARLGVEAVVLDEQPSPGGQIYRAVTETPVRQGTVFGDDYWRGLELARAFAGSGAAYLPGSTVFSVAPRVEDGRREIGISSGGKARLMQARHVIVATGAQERPMPIPGWTLPGVLTAGAAQILLKSAGLAPSGRTVLAGSGPLLWLLAAQLLRAGGTLSAILDTTPRIGIGLDMLSFAASPYLLKGLALMRETRRHLMPQRGVSGLRAEGDTRLRRVSFADRSAAARHIECDTLLLHQGVVPNANLAMSIGCAHRWDDAQLCFVPMLDAWGHSSADGVSIAGDGAGIAGAEAAAERGRLAALDAACRLGRIDEPTREREAAAPRRALARFGRGRAFLDRAFRPIEAHRIPAGDTIACRCEEVSAAQIVEAVRVGATGPNQLKAYLRCGMGPCQGRLCGLTVTELIAQARGKTPAEIGHYRLRPPVKPITVAELASLPRSEAEANAVARQ
ncbi:MAG: FAD-dependent oxidoreductase [Alphaproteobacteria bacterium]|nr:FAD-dependent oxidoreductase [Alphaproteobacteria bacterium]MCW5744257.1 FAD-dependent oxidoreductase [Alphaproteobacteria bacterium]